MNFLIKKYLRKGNSLRYKYSGNYLLKNRVKLLESYNIQTILDVGANTGQFAYYTRQSGYKNKIVSFEPTTQAYSVLEKFAKKDKNWQVVNSAIGHIDGNIEINISSNSQSSSIMDITPTHLNSSPDSIYKAKELVKINKLDSVVQNYVDDFDKTYLKIDTQGYEKKVFEGALESIMKVKGLQIELSFVELYNGETLIADMLKVIEKMGFKTHSIEPGFYDKKTGRILQVDGIFYRL